ncbi:MAG: DUF642 domain-containing protein [Pelagimonas sp.]|jgi:hypothetical protein|nr:DUF642 domain-containing protein [Pelagimonas sp.]
MPVENSREFILGSNPQVVVTLKEDDGSLILRVDAQDDAANVDIDALFFNFVNDDVIPGLQMWPAVGQLPITGFDAGPNSQDTVSNGAQIDQKMDAKIEFGTESGSTTGDVDAAGITFWIEADIDLNLDSIDPSSLTAVINSDNGDGEALTTTGSTDLGGDGGGTDGGETTLGDDILVNGALESSIGNNSWSYRGDVDGWSNANSHAGIETWGNNFLGVEAKDGDSFIELDSTNSSTLDSVYQDVQTEDGQTYQLDFSAAQRGADSESVEVYWNGDLVATVSPDGANTWNDFTFEVTGTGGEDRLEFRELAGENDSLGPLLDAISLRPIETTDGGEDGGEDGGTETVTITETTEVLGEDFSGHHADAIAGRTRWDVKDGELNTDGCDDGCIWFDRVELEGDAKIEFDARSPNTQNFENGGWWGDKLEVWALKNDSEWVHLDTFVVNDEGTALVGNETSQSIGADSNTLSYAGGDLEGADSLQLFMYSKITASNEDIYFDNLSISDSVETEIEVPVGTEDPEAWWEEHGNKDADEEEDDMADAWV